MAKYVVHLPGGGTLDIEVAGDPMEYSVNRWLRDDNGVLVNLDRVVAIVPAEQAAKAADADPAWVVDGDGDRWERQADGRYAFIREGGSLSDLRGYTLERIEEAFRGIRERG